MTDEDFRYWKHWLERHVEAYDEITRTVFVEGFFKGMPKETVFTAAQISEILALRQMQKNKRPNEAATSGRKTNNTNTL